MSNCGKYTKTNRIDGKIIIVTGCNTGIGKETVLELAKRGGKIYMACRDIKKCDQARLEIIAESQNQNIFTRHLDLNSLESVRKFVTDFKNEEQRLDILINNAGVMNIPQSKTVDGFETHFGVNHLAHFLLTNLLLDLLKAGAPSRIINLSSGAHGMGMSRLNREDLNLDNNSSFTPWNAYCQSKLANILFTRELAKRLNDDDGDSGVVVNSVDPGAVRTDLQRHNYVLTKVFYPAMLLFFKNAKEGAQTSITLALDPELEKVSGKHFANCKVKKEAKIARNNETAEWLWVKSEQMCRL